jgi:hypothetical protein
MDEYTVDLFISIFIIVVFIITHIINIVNNIKFNNKYNKKRFQGYTSEEIELIKNQENIEKYENYNHTNARNTLSRAQLRESKASAPPLSLIQNRSQSPNFEPMSLNELSTSLINQRYYTNRRNPRYYTSRKISRY